MKSTAFVLICRLLVASVMFMTLHAARADMIVTDQAVSASVAQADRAAVLQAMSRAEVASQFQSMGLDPQTAKQRVAAMTDEEVHTLAGKLDSLPAGASSDWGWGLAAVILIAVAIYYVYNWKK